MPKDERKESAKYILCYSKILENACTVSFSFVCGISSILEIIYVMKERKMQKIFCAFLKYYKMSALFLFLFVK